MEGQSEPLDEIIQVNGYTARRRPSGLIGRLRETELHVIKDIVKFPDHVQLSGSHLGGMSIHLKLREWPSMVISSVNWVPTLLSCTVSSNPSSLRSCLRAVALTGCICLLGPADALLTSDPESYSAPDGPALLWLDGELSSSDDWHGPRQCAKLDSRALGKLAIKLSTWKS